jgi:hypothetical protein
MPSIRLANIRIAGASSWQFYKKKYEIRGDELSERPNHKIGRLLIAILITAETVEHLLVLQSTVLSLIEATPRLSVQRDPSDATQGFVEFDLVPNEEAGAESVLGTESDFHQATIGVALPGIEIDSDVGPLLEESIGLTVPIDVFDHPNALDSFITKKELRPWPTIRTLRTSPPSSLRTNRTRPNGRSSNDPSCTVSTVRIT